MVNKNKILIAQLIHKWKYFCITALLTLINFLYLIKIINTKNISFGDALGYLSLGIRPITNFDPVQAFRIPFLWLSLYLYIFYSLAAIIRATSSTYDYLTFFYFKKRTSYWFFKVRLTLLTISLHFIVIGVTTMLCILIFGSLLSINPTSIFWDYFIHNGPIISGDSFFFQTFVMPWLACSTIGILELTLIYFFGELQSFVFISIYLIISAFFTNPFLFGNYLMLLKSSLTGNSGVNNASGILIMFVSVLVFNTIGLLRIKRWDYMN